MRTRDLNKCFAKIIVMLFLAFLFLCGLSMASDPSSPSDAQLPQGVSQVWWSKVRKDIQRSGYNITWQNKTAVPGVTSAWQASNHNHHLRAYFLPEGMLVIPIGNKDRLWTWGISLVDYGMHGVNRSLAPVAPEADKNRITYTRELMKEWYINSKEGIEQGFTLLAPPGDLASTSNALVLGMEIKGDLKGSINNSKDTIEFKTEKGVTVVRMAQLKVFDAKGRKLSASYSLKGHALDMFIDTTGASYPITVDPIIDSPAWTVESDQDHALFGYSVASAGDVNGDGYSDAIVGAFTYENGEQGEGKVFVYYGSSAGLSDTTDWSAEGDMGNASFGYSVSAAGDVNNDGYYDIIIGAPYYTDGEIFEGRVSAYYGSASGLHTTADWSVESDQAIAFFGESVATAGDVNNDGYSDVIVGAYEYKNGESSEGKVFVYYGSSAGLSDTADWSAEGDMENASFGYVVSAAGDVNNDGYSDIIIGNPGYNNGEYPTGRILAYYGSASGLPMEADWSAEGNEENAWFGSCVATAGDVNGDTYSDIIISSRSGYYQEEEDQGWSKFKVSAYYGSSSGLMGTSDWVVESDQEESYFGDTAATAGDVNNDGYSDVVVGAPYYDNGESNEGGAFVYYGSASGLSSTADWMAESDQVGACFGDSVATAGDVNGDGYSDIIIGATYNSSGSNGGGEAFLYYGSGSDDHTDNDDTDDENTEDDGDNDDGGGCFIATAACGLEE